MEQLSAKPVEQSLEFLSAALKEVPAAAVVLGSGVSVLEGLHEEQKFPYQEIFGLSPGVAGHDGSLSYGYLESVPVAVLRGRFHAYEGHSWDVVTRIAHVITQLGVRHLYLTNAAGGLNRNFKVGDLMVLTGYRDLLNPRLKETGLLPALNQPPADCGNELTEHLIATGEKLNALDAGFRPVRQGVYAGLLGPAYETLAEIEMLRRLNVDAVGMSTVPELETVRSSQATAAAVSVVTNVWNDEPIGGHQEVLEAAREASKRLDKLLRTAIAG